MSHPVKKHHRKYLKSQNYYIIIGQGLTLMQDSKGWVCSVKKKKKKKKKKKRTQCVNLKSCVQRPGGQETGCVLSVLANLSV